MMTRITKTGLVVALMMSAPSFAGYEVEIGDDAKLTFGGYFKVDARNVSGDLGYRDFWVGNNGVKADTNQTRIHARESRFNVKYQQGGVTGFLEYDFYNAAQPTGGAETISGAHTLRLRHAFVKYENWTLGQTWSTFMPLASIADALDFGGAHVGQAFVRQGQIRYSRGGLEVALENPSTGNGSDQYIPDLVGRYTWKGDWGQVAVAGLVRNLEGNDIQDAADGTQFAYNIHGRIKTFGRDDFRFSYNGGNPGRYVSPGANPNDSAIDGEIYEVQAYTVAYRHFWTEDLRSSLYYGAMKMDDLIGPDGSADRQHLGINLIKQLTPKLSVGVEVGNYKTESGDSNYYQLSAKYLL